ncbi:MAG: hypothetical protein ACXAD7_07810 [Candidatus Kariarchaeaceae archaeon]|jgi:hypothetical protein
MRLISNYRRAQLFLIEVIIALTVLIVLVTILFSSQTLSPPQDQTNLDARGSNAINLLVESGELWTYYEFANYSYYTIGNKIFDENNVTKLGISNTIESAIPLIANFKVFVYRYNTTAISGEEWVRIDIINFSADSPTGSDIVIVEHYSPGFNGVFVPFKFQLNLWYEVVV